MKDCGTALSCTVAVKQNSYSDQNEFMQIPYFVITALLEKKQTLIMFIHKLRVCSVGLNEILSSHSDFDLVRTFYGSVCFKAMKNVCVHILSP